jgi:hypothetical protein
MGGWYSKDKDFDKTYDKGKEGKEYKETDNFFHLNNVELSDDDDVELSGDIYNSTISFNEDCD